MLSVNPIRDRHSLVIKFNATDNAVAGFPAMSYRVRVFIRSKPVRLNQFDCKWNRPLDAFVDSIRRLNETHEDFARFNDLTLAKSLNLGKRQLSVDVADFRPFRKGLVSEVVYVLFVFTFGSFIGALGCDAIANDVGDNRI